MKTVVVGAGIGGLVLAQALARAGEEVEVHDRDEALEDTGGYRLHLDARACGALRRHLTPEVFQAIQASAAGAASFRRFHVLDHRMRLLAAAAQEPGEEVLMIGRVQLRVLLATGLDDRLNLGSRYVGHEVGDDGSVQVRFADGSSTTADLLVGADGAGSVLAATLAGGPTSQSLGLSGVAGRTPLTERTRDLVPELLRQGPGLAFGPGGVGLFLTAHDPTRAAVVDPRACTTVPAQTEPATLVWGLVATDALHPQDVSTRSGAELVSAVDALLAGWHPGVRELVHRSDPAGVAHFALRACDPDRPLTPWPAGPVTALGDAVHAMPPTGGQGAATAIRDADVLAGQLARVRAGQVTAATAVAAFHDQMAGYAPDAVRESLAPVRWIRASAHPAARLLATAALPAAAGGAAALRRLRRTA